MQILEGNLLRKMNSSRTKREIKGRKARQKDEKRDKRTKREIKGRKKEREQEERKRERE